MMKRLSGLEDVKFCLKNTTFLVISILILTGCDAKKEPPIEEKIVVNKPAQTLENLGLESKLEDVSVMLPSCAEKHCPQVNIQHLNSNYVVLDQLIDQYIVNYISKLVKGFEFSETTQIETNDTTNDDMSMANLAEEEQERDKQIATAMQPKAEKSLSRNQLLIQQIQPDINKFIQLSDEVKSLGSSAPLTLYIKPQVLNPKGPIVTIVLNASHYIGGAHGSTSQQYINFSLEDKRPLNLEMLIQQDKRKQFNDLVYQKFKAWVADLQPDIEIKTYEELWIFKVSENFYLGNKSLILQYGEYEIGPYAVGLPRLEIPYEELMGILEPKYLPATLMQEVKSNVKEDQVKTVP